MHLGILFYSDTLTFASDPKNILGRAVANNSFLTACFEHLPDWQKTIIVTSLTEKEYLADSYKKYLDQSQVTIVPLLELQNHLSKNKLDALHIPGPALHKGFHIRNALASHNFPVTGVTHSLGHSPFLDWMILNLAHKPKPYDSLICTTPTAKQSVAHFIKYSQNAIGVETTLPTSVIPLGVTKPNQKNPDARKTLNIPDAATVLLSVSRFNYYTKNDFIPLIWAFKETLKQNERKNKKTILILAGSAPDDLYTKILNEVIDENNLRGLVHLVLNPSDSVKWNLYDAADIFVALCDNYQETFGLSLVEAQMAGLPIVASDWDGYKSLVKDEVNGFLIPTTALKNHQNLNFTSSLQLDSLNHLYHAQATATNLSKTIEKLLLLINDEEKRKEMAKASLANSDNYTWKAVIEQYKSLWENLSQQAKADTQGNTSTSLTLNYLEAFEHYPTNHLEQHSQLITSQSGLLVLKGEQNLRTYNAMDEILQVPLLGKALKGCLQAKTLKILTNELKTEFEEDDVAYHCLWLSKYGLLSIS